MGFTNYFKLYITISVIGVILLDTEKLREFEGIKYYLVKLLLLFLLILPMLLLYIIHNNSESGYTIYKFANYYELDYGDKLDFTYHIKTNKSDNKKSKCKIKGTIENNNLKITELKDCDNDEEIKESYLKLITSTGNFDDNKPIRVNSEIKNFTWE